MLYGQYSVIQSVVLYDHKYDEYFIMVKTFLNHG